MAEKLNVDRIWWRNLPLGEFYNIERHPRLEGGNGSLYIEIPTSLVPQTLDFLDVPSIDDLPVTIQAGVAGQAGLSGPIEFHRKSGGRMRIARQNRQQANLQRHPAWTTAQGFPTAPDGIHDRNEALPYFPEGGLRVYIVRTVEGHYFAGFTEGLRPGWLTPNDPAWDLYTQGKTVGGVIDAG
jgi:hypothetical protein